VVNRAAYISIPVVALVIVGTTLLVARGPADRDLTLTAQVEQGQVSKMLTGKGVISAAKTADLNFKAANYIHSVDVQIGDKVKKGQKVAEEDNGGLRRAVLQSQQALAQQQAALNLILNDYTVPADFHIWDRAKVVADQAWKDVRYATRATRYAAQRDERAVWVAEQALDKARAALRAAGCNPDGTQTNPLLPVPTLATCQSDKATVDADKTTLYNARTVLGTARRAVNTTQGPLRLTYTTDRQLAVAAYNAYNIARINRPNQILAQQALTANALVNVGNANGSLENSYVYAPIDGTVSAIAGTVGEFSNGGSNLTPNTPVAPGGVAKVPTVGDLAGNDQKNLTGGQGPNLGLQSVLPGGNTFMQLSDISAFSAVTAFNQADAAQITAGNAAKMTLDSLAGKVLDGKVTAVSPIGTPGPNGAPMYYATVLLNKDEVPDGLKSGLTGNVSVVTSTIAPKAMVVPTSAVTTDDGESFVDVPGPGGTPQKKEFTRGKVGDDNTEVVSGLKQGDTVLVPSTGPLPTPADDKAPPVPTNQTITFDQTPPPALKQPAAAAPPAPAAAPPAAVADTYPGDNGAIPDGDTGSPSPSNNTPGGVNPFATPAPPPAPANTPGN
jgi:HlyD family secretion protein